MTHFLIGAINRKNRLAKRYDLFFLDDKSFNEFINKQIYAKGYLVKALHNVRATQKITLATNQDFTLKLDIAISNKVIDLKKQIKETLNNNIALNQIYIKNSFGGILKDNHYLLDTLNYHIFIDLGIIKVNSKSIAPSYKL